MKNPLLELEIHVKNAEKLGYLFGYNFLIFLGCSGKNPGRILRSNIAKPQRKYKFDYHRHTRIDVVLSKVTEKKILHSTLDRGRDLHRLLDVLQLQPTIDVDEGVDVAEHVEHQVGARGEVGGGGRNAMCLKKP